MVKTKKTVTAQKVIHAGLQIMAARETQDITMGDIADKLGVEETALYPHIQKPIDIFSLIARETNTALAKTYQRDDSVPKRDQYFDLIMERLDLLQPYKTDIARFIKSLPKHPLTVAMFLPDFERGVTLMMRLAGDLDDQSGKHIKRVGLMGVYLSTMRAWIKDDTQDSAKTMAHLDKALDKLDKVKTFSFKRQAA